MALKRRRCTGRQAATTPQELLALRDTFDHFAQMLRIAFYVFAIASLFVTAAAAIDTNRHVILITVDGVAAFYLDDPKAPLQNLRRLADEGVLAEGMRVSNPAITWPNHTTLVTGVRPAKHSVLVNGLLMRDAKGAIARDQESSQAEMVAVPTVFDLLHARGYITAGVNWPCTPKSTTLHFNMPDVPKELDHTPPHFIEELTAAKILNESSGEAFDKKTSPKRDAIWSEIARYVMRTHRPNLMLLHFLITDSIQHQVGPQCPEAYEALGIVDQHIGKLLQTLDETGLREKTTILITADHGFSRVYKQVVCAAILRKAGLLETADGQSRVQAIAAGGTALVYLNAEATKDADRKKIIELFEKQEGIERILHPKDFAKYGYPTPDKNPRMADMVLSAKDGYSFSALEMVKEPVIPTRDGGIGAHGYLSTNPKMNAMFIAAGRRIAKGKKIGMIDNVDVAPTIAHLMGQNMPGTDGKVLKQILQK